jgi:hypothetical protein
MKKIQGFAVLAAGLSVTAAAHAQFASVAPPSNAKSIGGQGSIAVDEYMIDDGSTENLLGWTAGGTMAWIQWFDAAGGSDSISAIRIINGSALYPGYGNGNGSPVSVGIWSDPNGDGEPSDSVLLASVNTTVQNIDTDTYQTVAIGPTAVTGRFFIGAWIAHNAGQYVAPMDQNSSPQANRAYVFGNYNGYGGSFNPNNPGDTANNIIYEMSSIGFPTDFCVRANAGGGGGYTLLVTGNCPGTVTVAWSGAQPNKQQGIVFASSTGSFVVPNGPCQGTQLGLSAQNLQLVNTIGTGNGAGSVNGQTNSGACPGHLQLVTISSPCVTSNVDDIPG